MLKHPWRLAALGIVSAAAVGWLALRGSDRYHEPLADWVAGVATLAAFLAAVIAAVFAAGAFSLESEREQRWTDSQIAAQASLVAAWFGTHQAEAQGDPKLAGLARLWRDEGIWVRNASEVPVYVARASISLHGFPIGVVDVGVIPPGAEPIFNYLPQEVEDRVKAHVRKAEDDDWPNEPSVSLFFRDASGVSWLRHESGQLQRSGEPWWINEPAGLLHRSGEGDE